MLSMLFYTMKAKYLLTLLATLTLIGCGNNQPPQGEPPITPPDPGPEVGESQHRPVCASERR